MKKRLTQIIRSLYEDYTADATLSVSPEHRREWAQVADAEAKHSALALDVADFMYYAGQEVNTKPVLHPNLKIRVRWIREEVSELEQAIQDDDLQGVADALVDIVYITLGGAVECGLPFGHLWAEVHKSNMAKVPFNPKTGTREVLRGPDGKVQKPKGWRAPDLGSVLRSTGYKPKGEA